MDNEKIILLVVGAIIGFVVSLAKDWLMEGKKQKEKEKQFKREKLEEVFSLLDKINTNAMNPIQLYDDNVDSTKLTMIIRFYFPNINNEYQKFIKEYAEVTRIKINGENHLDKYHKTLGESYRLLCTQIVDESRQL